MNLFNWTKKTPAGDSATKGLTHMALVIGFGGEIYLIDGEHHQITDPEIMEAFDNFFINEGDLEEGTYPLVYDPATKTFSGLGKALKSYHLFHTKGKAPRLINPETGTEEVDDDVQSALALALRQINADTLTNGQYDMLYNTETGTFHGFGGGTSGGGGASITIPENGTSLPVDGQTVDTQDAAFEPSGQEDLDTNVQGTEPTTPQAGEDPACVVDPETPTEAPSETTTTVEVPSGSETPTETTTEEATTETSEADNGSSEATSTDNS